jgi:hypothetical protein
MIVATLLLIAAIGLGLIARELQRAPEGFEDNNGFHITHDPMADDRAVALHAADADHGRRQPAPAH